MPATMRHMNATTIKALVIIVIVAIALYVVTHPNHHPNYSQGEPTSSCANPTDFCTP